MQLKKEIQLKSIHTFGLNSTAKALVTARNVSDLKEALKLPYKKKMILGGGSNLVFVNDYDGLVIKNELKGIKILRHFEKSVHVSSKAGEQWHGFVLWCIKKKFGGLENLSLIPGTVGAAPIQNIGAYGVEVKDFFVKLKAIEISSGQERTFWGKDCAFGYRNSFFKNKGKGKYVITEVVFKLSKKPHKFKISYGSIASRFENLPKRKQTIKALSDIVIEIRSAKLPDPKKIGNCGSFFKNPIISKRIFYKLSKNYPEIPNYPTSGAKVKLAAGWLIDQCGWKGKKIGNVGCYKNQALVIVNHGNASGTELLEIIQLIKSSVLKKFEIMLEEEVNLIH